MWVPVQKASMCHIWHMKGLESIKSIECRGAPALQCLGLLPCTMAQGCGLFGACRDVQGIPALQMRLLAAVKRAQGHVPAGRKRARSQPATPTADQVPLNDRIMQPVVWLHRHAAT